MTVLSLLSSRERNGGRLVGDHRRGGKGGVTQPYRVSRVSSGAVGSTELSSVAAWNRSRMQNMILAVGPGTPASKVIRAGLWESEDEDNDDDGNDEDDDEDLDYNNDDVDDGDDADEDDDGVEGSEDMAADGWMKVETTLEANDEDTGEEGKDDPNEKKRDDFKRDESRESNKRGSDDDDDDDDDDDSPPDVDANGKDSKSSSGAMGDAKEDSDADDDDDDASDHDEERSRRRQRWMRQMQEKAEAAAQQAVQNANSTEPNQGSATAAALAATEAFAQVFAAAHEEMNEDQRNSVLSEGGTITMELGTVTATISGRDSTGQETGRATITHTTTAQTPSGSRRTTVFNAGRCAMAAFRRLQGISARDTGADEEEDDDDEDRDDGDIVAGEGHGSTRDRGTVAAFTRSPVTASLRHGGCINTAAWLDCPWRVSCTVEDGDFTSSHSAGFGGGTSKNGLEKTPRLASKNQPRHAAVPTVECPTQLVTSGDDRVVKFWDVSAAMGMTSPLPGTRTTATPFSTPILPPTELSESVVAGWKSRHRRGAMLPGSVRHLATLHTGHRGNVFHVTPVPFRQGIIATCAADGHLRISDVACLSASSSLTGTSVGVVATGRQTPENQGAVVYSPEYDEEAERQFPSGFFALRPSMSFSHHFLDTNTGLLCTERGLKKFDLRLPPRSQDTGSVLMGLNRTCKACAVWSAPDSGVGSREGVDSAYVFAGGTSSDVGLYDLRMTDSSLNKMVQRYRPEYFSSNPDSAVSVSGIDVSKDGRELLVSYENDQIYTFPIMPSASSPAGPSIEELELCKERRGIAEEVVSEFATYGGHLNRFTFLKCAKYAGPCDEYICTGSDSGRAWIYERGTGAVVSLLNADRKTCNGIVPHPTLPVFITYGIESTAKLWRATPPVDLEVDDSFVGRVASNRKRHYQKAPLVSQWKTVQSNLSSFDPDSAQSDVSILPDEVPLHDSDFGRHFDILSSAFFAGRSLNYTPATAPFIGNDMQNLPSLLRENYFTSLQAAKNGDEEPVKSGLQAFRARVSIMRLHHQAAQLGLLVPRKEPWKLLPLGRTVASQQDEGGACAHQADRIADHPCDWLPYDKHLTRDPEKPGFAFDDSPYSAFMHERYSAPPLSCRGSRIRRVDVSEFDEEESVEATEEEHRRDASAGMDTEETSMSVPSGSEPNFKSDKTQEALTVESSGDDSGERKEDEGEEGCANGFRLSKADAKLYARRLEDRIVETVTILKDGGNSALQKGLVFLAARRYDRAIRYCATLFLRFPTGNMSSCLTEHQEFLNAHGGRYVNWSPLLKALVSVRLNLSMTLLRTEIEDADGAAKQAHLAIEELRPFATSRGKVVVVKTTLRSDDQGNSTVVRSEDEPVETFKDAKELQAKAFFRLGNAQFAKKDFCDAVRSFENSMRSTRAASPGRQTDAVVARRLAEARREHLRRKKRHRKKFKFMFSDDAEEEGGERNGGDTAQKSES